MGLNSTASAERIHIGFFGKRNAGKSSIVNAITNQELAVVSEIPGTTTDPVRKAMEILPLGPVVVIDTPGLDDEGSLGEKRVEKARRELSRTNIAVLVVDSTAGLSSEDLELVRLFQARRLPFILVLNKADLLEQPAKDGEQAEAERISAMLSDAELPADTLALYVSAVTAYHVNELKELLASFGRGLVNEKRVIADLLDEDDAVILVIPIDESAPKGRLILPQQQTIRDILDAHCTVIACQDTELQKTLGLLKDPPKMVVTDSQAFGKVAKVVPKEILLTSFSILFARYKGDLETLVRGAAALGELKDGDRVLISEGCTHHRQCNDIGSVKMPGWIEQYSGAKPEYAYTSGGGFPEDLSPYKVIVHCGGCMLNEAEMQHRIECAKAAGIPIVNYGIAIAEMHGILRRSLGPFPEILKLLQA